MYGFQPETPPDVNFIMINWRVYKISLECTRNIAYWTRYTTTAQDIVHSYANQNRCPCVLTPGDEVFCLYLQILKFI